MSRGTGEVASVLAEVGDASLVDAAVEFAAAGVPVFPCTPGGKRPLAEHGFHDATTEPTAVSRWWRRWPAANIGLPTGAVSGVVVVDVDVHGPVNGYDAFEHAEAAGLVDGWRVLAASPSGGMHAYYPATPGVNQPCWQAARAGIDFRGDGGYIVVPPSIVETPGGSAAYRVRQIDSRPGRPLADRRLREFLDPRPAPAGRRRAGVSRPVEVSRLASWVAARGEGERNRGLFWAACRLAEAAVPVGDALDALTPAGGSAGLGEREVAVTVRSAYRTARPAARIESTARKNGWLDHAVPASGPMARGLS